MLHEAYPCDKTRGCAMRAAPGRKPGRLFRTRHRCPDIGFRNSGSHKTPAVHGLKVKIALSYHTVGEARVGKPTGHLPADLITGAAHRRPEGCLNTRHVSATVCKKCKHVRHDSPQSSLPSRMHCGHCADVRRVEQQRHAVCCADADSSVTPEGHKRVDIGISSRGYAVSDDTYSTRVCLAWNHDRKRECVRIRPHSRLYSNASEVQVCHIQALHHMRSGISMPSKAMADLSVRATTHEMSRRWARTSESSSRSIE